MNIKAMKTRTIQLKIDEVMQELDKMNLDGMAYIILLQEKTFKLRQELKKRVL